MTPAVDDDPAVRAAVLAAAILEASRPRTRSALATVRPYLAAAALGGLVAGLILGYVIGTVRG